VEVLDIETLFNLLEKKVDGHKVSVYLGYVITNKSKRYDPDVEMIFMFLKGCSMLTNTNHGLELYLRSSVFLEYCRVSPTGVSSLGKTKLIEIAAAYLDRFILNKGINTESLQVLREKFVNSYVCLE
jgi:hypothetical protein